MDQSRWIFLALSLVLAAAALLKLWAILTDPFLDLHTGFPVWVLGMAVVVDATTAALLFSRHSFSFKWLVSVWVWGGFALVSGVRAAIGFSSCGCFGSASVPPWASALFSVLILIVLVWMVRAQRSNVIQTASEGWREFRCWVGDCRYEVAGTTVAFCLLLVILALPGNRLTTLLDAPEEVVAESVRLEGLEVGVPRTTQAVLKNTSDKPVSLIGANSSCGCVAVDLKRQVIHPHQEIEINVVVVPNTAGAFRQRLVCFLNSENQQRVGVEILGNCRASQNITSDR